MNAIFQQTGSIGDGSMAADDREAIPAAGIEADVALKFMGLSGVIPKK